MSKMIELDVSVVGLDGFGRTVGEVLGKDRVRPPRLLPCSFATLLPSTILRLLLLLLIIVIFSTFIINPISSHLR